MADLSDIIDDRAYNVLYAEAAGGSDAEISAVGSVLLNLIDKYGYEKALKRFASYTTKSPQYIKAKTGKLNPYERSKYQAYKAIMSGLIENPEMRLPYTHMENINTFGEPAWAGSMGGLEDIGRQRFYHE